VKPNFASGGFFTFAFCPSYEWDLAAKMNEFIQA
jgi:hypothetical protein